MQEKQVNAFMRIVFISKSASDTKPAKNYCLNEDQFIFFASYFDQSKGCLFACPAITFMPVKCVHFATLQPQLFSKMRNRRARAVVVRGLKNGVVNPLNCWFT